MKRIISLIIIMVLALAMTMVPASAAGANVGCSFSSTNVKVGDQITVTVSVSGCAQANTGSVQLSYDKSKFEIVSGDWLLTNTNMATFKINTLQGAFSCGTRDINGSIFKFVIKAKEASVNKVPVTVSMEFKVGAQAVGSGSKATEVKISCATHKFGDWSEVSAPDCTAKGKEQRTCSACGATESRDVAALGHNWGVWTKVGDPGCTTKGKEERVCQRDSAHKETRDINPTGHDWKAWETVTKPTCTTAGEEKRVCKTDSKHIETRPVKATGHNWGSWTQSKAPTCTDKGTETRTCKTDSKHTETREVKALGHKFSNPTVTKEPTCTETGIETGTCTRCKKETTNTIKAKGHSFDKWEDVKAATCTEAGEQKRKCKNCDHTETKKVDALGHDFENPTVITEPTIATTGIAEGKCKRCGEVTQQILPCKATDATTGIVFEAEQGVFQSGTQITVTEIKRDAADYANIQTALKSVAENFKVYDIDAVLNGAVVQSTGKYKATFAIPEDFGTKVAVYGIAADGTATLIESVVSEDGKTVTAEISDYSYYTVCDLSSVESNKTDAPVKDEDKKGEGKDNSLIIYIVIGALVLLIIAGVVIFIVMKKKKVTAEVSEPDDTFTIE